MNIPDGVQFASALKIEPMKAHYYINDEEL